MQLLRPDSVLFAALLPIVFGGCVFRCGDGHEDHSCEGPGGCWDDDEEAVVVSVSVSVGSGSGGAGGQGGQGGEGGSIEPPACDPSEVICACTNACPGSLTCVGGLCLDACNFDYECGPGTVCGNGQCVPACDATTPCDSGYACVGGGCLPDPLNPQCVDDFGCDGLVCADGLCTSPCVTHADCAPGQLCNGATSACVADAAPVPLCDASTPCAGQGQSCLDDACHYACLTVMDCKLIDARFDGCDRGFCKTDLELDPECTASQPCAGGAACVSNVCVP